MQFSKISIKIPWDEELYKMVSALLQYTEKQVLVVSIFLCHTLVFLLSNTLLSVPYTFCVYL